MMKHLNKYLSLALALVLCLSLAACGESNEDYEELTYKAKKIDFSTIDFPERFGYLKLQTT